MPSRRVRRRRRPPVPIETLYEIIMFYTGGKYRGVDINCEQLTLICNLDSVRRHPTSYKLQRVWDDMQHFNDYSITDLGTRTYRFVSESNNAETRPTGILYNFHSDASMKRQLRTHGKIKDSFLWLACFGSRGPRPRQYAPNVVPDIF